MRFSQCTNYPTHIYPDIQFMNRSVTNQVNVAAGPQHYKLIKQCMRSMLSMKSGLATKPVLSDPSDVDASKHCH